MKSFSGGATFSFEIERYLDKSSGAYLTMSDPRLPSEPDDFEFERIFINLTVTGTASFTPGRMTGPWEDSYQDESEYEVESVTNESGDDWSDKLTSLENDELIEELFRWAEKNSQDFDYEPYID